MRSSGTGSSRGRVLYLTYDGLEDHIAQSQILPYVEGLARRGWQFTVVSHEKHREVSTELRERLASVGVEWVRAQYHRGSPVRTVPYHVGAELVAALRASRANGTFDVVHARSYLPGLSALPLARAFGSAFLFDMRGFWVDEKIDSGLWHRGAVYTAGKQVEKRLFKYADAIVALTDASRDELRTWDALAERTTPITVIPTCVDVTRYGATEQLAPSGPLALGYAGSLGARYPIEAMARVVARVRERRPGSRWVVLTQAPRHLVDDACRAAGVPLDAVEVASVAHGEIPARLSAVHATLSFVKPSFASLGSCPTKFAESLAAGRPVVVNTGVGDCADIVQRHRVGSVTDLSLESLRQAADELVDLLADRDVERRCRTVAADRFALEGALDAYDAVYDRLTSSRRGASANGSSVARNAEGS